MANAARDRTIWIDLENTPHVPFFVPIIRDLEAAGLQVVLTGRDFAQTKELIHRAGLNVTIIGREHGRPAVNALCQALRSIEFWLRYGGGEVPDGYAPPLFRVAIAKLFPGASIAQKIVSWFDQSRLRKSGSIILRALLLAKHMRSKHVRLAVGHGSRGLLLASRLLRIPLLTLYDYEGADVAIFNRLSTWVMTPEVIPRSKLEEQGLKAEKHLTYPGLKEEVYACDFQPTPMEELRLDPEKIIVLLRPPSDTAHYRSEQSQKLFDDLVEKLAWDSKIIPICIPRTEQQRTRLEYYADKANLRLPSKAVDGLNVIYHSDLVIGGGGTVNREAAALGVPVVTIFRGPEGAVDRWLIDAGKMVSINSADEIEPMLRKRSVVQRTSDDCKTRSVIINTIVQLAGA